jgi:large subunit ribosomal protein L3
MITGLLGRKIGMTQIFSEDGTLISVTMIEAGPCTVIQKKTREKDGYNAVQLGFIETNKDIKRPIKGQFDKAKVMKPTRFLKEIRCDHIHIDDIEIGEVIGVDIFNTGDIVNISGRSKGKGFAGVIKRHGFSGAPASRGTHEYFRHGGSIGMHTFPARVFKGKKMPGRMGNEKVTLRNLEVVRVIKEKNILLVKGSTPGSKGRLLIIQNTKKAG